MSMILNNIINKCISVCICILVFNFICFHSYENVIKSEVDIIINNNDYK